MNTPKHQIKATSKEGRVVIQNLSSKDQLNRWTALLKKNGWRVAREKASS